MHGTMTHITCDTGGSLFRVSQNNDHRIATKKHLAYEPILVDWLRLLLSVGSATRNKNWVINTGEGYRWRHTLHISVHVKWKKENNQGEGGLRQKTVLYDAKTPWSAQAMSAWPFHKWAESLAQIFVENWHLFDSRISFSSCPFLPPSTSLSRSQEPCCNVCRMPSHDQVTSYCYGSWSEPEENKAK